MVKNLVNSVLIFDNSEVPQGSGKSLFVLYFAMASWSATLLKNFSQSGASFNVNPFAVSLTIQFAFSSASFANLIASISADNFLNSSFSS